MEKTSHHIHNKIVARCRQGDRRAQYELYNLYARAMYNTAYRITNDTAEAEDVLQEAFIRVFRKLDTYKGESSIGAWIKAIVVNTAINHLRRNKQLVPVTDQLPEHPAEPDGYNDREPEVARIRAAIGMLPDGYRLVLSLYLLEGYDHQEIARILGITESTSKTQYLRAKQKLRKILQQEKGQV